MNSNQYNFFHDTKLEIYASNSKAIHLNNNLCDLLSIAYINKL